MKKRSKVLALMESCWKDAGHYPREQDARDALWTYDDHLDWALSADEAELQEAAAATILDIGEDDSALFDQRLAEQILSGEITRDDLTFAARVISRYQFLVQQASVNDPDLAIQIVEFTEDGESWETVPRHNTLTFMTAMEAAQTLLFTDDVQRVRITHGPQVNPESVEFDNGPDLIRWIYDRDRPLRNVALHLLRYMMYDEAAQDDDAAQMPYFPAAEAQFFKLPWMVQGSLLARADAVIVTYSLAQEAEEERKNMDNPDF